MALHVRPVGPLPQTVYWRRRAVVVACVVLLLVLLSRCGGDDPASEALAQPSPSASAAAPVPVPAGSPVPTASPSAPGPCADDVLRVTATPDRTRYGASPRPVLRLAVRNGGTVPCTRALGRGAVELLVFSGSDRIWSSDDCAEGGPADPVVLQPQQLEVTTLTWGGRRSRPGCPDGAEKAEPGTYRVVGRVGQLRTDGSPFVVG
ncbi:MAG: hypothetical protein JWM64_1781 [Frankiales bacterium]|nr:hypothetical protein [Frankiales bacterium]